MRKIGIAMVWVWAAAASAGWKPLPMPPFDSTGRDPVSSVAAYGDALWAMTSEGLFRSADSGRTWRTARPQGFPRHPRFGSGQTGLFPVGGCLYASALPGLYSTCDGGATWTSLTGTASLSGITRMAGDSSLLMAGSPYAYDMPYLSSDRGRTWKPTPASFPDGRLPEGLFQDGARLWLSAGGSVFASDDNGKTWQGASAPVSGTAQVGRRLGMLWVWGRFSTLAASGDGGKTWETREVALPDPIGSFEATSLVSAAGLLFTSGTGDDGGVPVGVFMSSDSGKTWAPRNQGLPVNTVGNGSVDLEWGDASMVFALGRILIAKTNQGLYRSDDLGAHWRASNRGLPPLVNGFTGPDMLYPYQDRVYAHVYGDYADAWYVSGDTGRSWQAWRPGIASFQSLAFTASAAFVLRRSGDSVPSDPVYRSTDGMKTWSRVRGPWESMPFTAPGSIFASGTHVYVVEENGSGYWHSPDEGAAWEADSSLIYRQSFRWHTAIGNARFRDEGWSVGLSLDSGRAWKRSLSAGPVLGAAVLDRTLLLLIPGTTASEDIFATQDLGKTWRSTLQGSVGSHVNGLTAFAGRAYAATDSGLRVSSNGLDWEYAPAQGLSARGVRLVAAEGSRLLALTDSGLYVSVDSGSHWRACGLDKPGETAWLAAWKNALFAGKPGSGVWASADTGRTWTKKIPALLMGMAAGPKNLVIANGLYAKFQSISDVNAGPVTGSGFPGKQNDYFAMAQADGGLYLSQAEGGFSSAGPFAPWSPMEFPGTWPHDVLAGDGQRLAVTASEGIFLRGSAQGPWVPAEAGLPKDEVSALAMDAGRLFAALPSQGLWMSSALPVAARPAVAEPFLAGAPAILPAADGSPVFRLRLERPALIRLSLHAATGRLLASFEGRVSRGIQDVSAPLRRTGAVFYRLEARPEDGPGEGRVFRGRIP
jgi:hypothetical protein